ncbi:iron-containing alcohol dehydrogenase family protein [Piscibacillus salipiscarius]|nr:iron-containing alcohol dehydrogenase [Piscibacillus salipiscarius]
MICVPTTAGTGSEVTSVAVVTDEQQERKMVLASPLIGPDVAIVDPILTASLPRHMVAATGMDAFVHALESYTSINANPFTDSLALQSMKMLKEHLPASYAHSFNHESKEQVHIASTMAGVAFNAAGLGLVHACSHPMTALYKVPHGLANAIILPKVIDYNLIANKSKYADIARILKPELISCDDDSAASFLVEALEEFNKQLDIPRDFSYIEGVMPGDIDKLVHDALHDQLTIPLNPRKVNSHDVKQIYQKLLPQLNTDSVAYSN